MSETVRSRVSQALGGVPSTPPVTGLTFASDDVLSSVAPGCPSTGECLLATARALALDFVFVPSAAPWASAAVADRGATTVMWVVDGPLWPVLSGSGRPLSEAIAATARDASSLGPRLDAATARARETIRAGVAAGAGAIVIAEDLAGRDGLLFTPQFVRSEVVPRLAVLAAAAGGVPVVLHSDGDVGAIFPLLPGAGFSAVHAGGGVDRDRFEELFWEARRSGLAVIGGIQTSSLHRGTYAAVRAGTHAALLAQAGGLLVADDGGISTPEEMSSFAAALGAVRASVVPTGREA